MRHLDQELLAVHALGEPLAGDAADHLAGCVCCAAEARSLAAVVRVGRALVTGDAPVEPPERVWAGIAATTGIDPNAMVDARTPRSAARPGFVLAASAAGIIAGGAAVLGWQAWTSGDAAAGHRENVVASATLDPLADPVGSGTAELVVTEDERRLVVDLPGAGTAGDYLEVWLLAPDVSGLVPLGALTEPVASFPVPDALDVTAYPIVDVSLEPYDGNPAHSGNSLVRGRLDPG